MTRREIEQAARDAGPWTDAAAKRITALRELPRPLTAEERDELAVLRQRETIEAYLRRVRFFKGAA